MNHLKAFILSPAYTYIAAVFAVYFFAHFSICVFQNAPMWEIFISLFASAGWVYDANLSYEYHKNRKFENKYSELEGF